MKEFMNGRPIFISAGAGGNCARPMRLSDPSPVLDKNRAPMGPEILSSTGAGVWRRPPMVFPDSSSVLDKFQSANEEATLPSDLCQPLEGLPQTRCLALSCGFQRKSWGGKEGKGVLFFPSPKPHPSKPHPCNISQAKTEVALQFSECCAAEVALQHSLFCSVEPKRVVSKRAVLADVPPERKPERGYVRIFPRNENRNEGTFACSPGTKIGTRVHSPKPPFYKTALLSPGEYSSSVLEPFRKAVVEKVGMLRGEAEAAMNEKVEKALQPCVLAWPRR